MFIIRRIRTDSLSGIDRSGTELRINTFVAVADEIRPIIRDNWPNDRVSKSRNIRNAPSSPHFYLIPIDHFH